jgi:hypothetical protein
LLNKARPEADVPWMNDKEPCGNCGGLNKSTAAFCGQCFTALAGVPAAAMAGGGWVPAPVGGSLRGGAEPTVVRARQPEPKSFAVRLVALALALLGGFAGWNFMSQRNQTVTAEDESFTLSHSNYWEQVEESTIPIMAGVSPDVVLAHDEEAVIIGLDMAVPVGSAGSLRREDLQAIYDTQPFGIRLKKFSSPGKLSIAGRPSILEAEATFNYMGLSGDAHIVVVERTEGSTKKLFMLELTCISSDCSDASNEFKSIAETVTFN